MESYGPQETFTGSNSSLPFPWLVQRSTAPVPTPQAPSRPFVEDP